MDLKNFIAGVLTGVATGIVVSECISRMDRNVAPDSVLANVKDAFKKEGPIDGSWIVMKTEPFSNEVITMDVYRGGISRIKNGEVEQYEFAADASTGTVVELSKA
ncbi:hypothetical protein [Sporosarcina sp. G11-34]|uniref:hypothetical protein n=1 Tax=Sporosarcina sp. G11-34 TaxID=2849605 RepID=UPI0022A9A0A5|nr:hypothetical protein [Sporosarcina sp. G11-34]MCZ2257943.1 hypothetical protein [Sporosarcina sp. G11-34]